MISVIIVHVNIEWAHEWDLFCLGDGLGRPHSDLCGTSVEGCIRFLQGWGKREWERKIQEVLPRLCSTSLGFFEGRFKIIFNYFCILDWCFYWMWHQAKFQWKENQRGKVAHPSSPPGPCHPSQYSHPIKRAALAGAQLLLPGHTLFYGIL